MTAYDDVARRVRALGYEPGQLQAKWRTDPPPFAATAEWFGEAEDAVLDALVIEGGIAAWPGDGTSCVMQIIEAFAKRVP